MRPQAGYLSDPTSGELSGVEVARENIRVRRLALLLSGSLVT